MFRKIRRVRQTMSDEEAIAILKNGSVGVLALLGDEGYPYPPAGTGPAGLSTVSILQA